MQKRLLEFLVRHIVNLDLAKISSLEIFPSINVVIVSSQFFVRFLSHVL